MAEWIKHTLSLIISGIAFGIFTLKLCAVSNGNLATAQALLAESGLLHVLLGAFLLSTGFIAGLLPIGVVAAAPIYAILICATKGRLEFTQRYATPIILVSIAALLLPFFFLPARGYRDVVIGTFIVATGWFLLPLCGALILFFYYALTGRSTTAKHDIQNIIRSKAARYTLTGYGALPLLFVVFIAVASPAMWLPSEIVVTASVVEEGGEPNKNGRIGYVLSEDNGKLLLIYHSNRYIEFVDTSTVVQRELCDAWDIQVEAKEWSPLGVVAAIKTRYLKDQLAPPGSPDYPSCSDIASTYNLEVETEDPDKLSEEDDRTTNEPGYLIAGTGAISRGAPSRDGAILEFLTPNLTYRTDGYTEAGEDVLGSSRWYRLEGGVGWVHQSGGEYTSASPTN